MAQDFYAAFGKDEYGTIGNDTTINSADFAGVSFIAIQALEKRTQEIDTLKKENASQAARLEEIKNDNAALKTMLLQLRKEVDALQGIKKENLKP
jgi:septal ring factor EnvC (AmiA/AmiB activator)